ncbi:hypothetical protein M514_04211 [Trichuris suis]|uniref:PX domain-containing protein n=1 Tax=Trichuris suis TaxID=68888 RepID=A0A085NRN7_9BILA|nr:hypothetical protein M513_04211 [Trichuris suis]KFD72133.1 hypothetical protein M514_04211 [Trichuris suis]
MIAQCVAAVFLLNAFVVIAKQDLTLCILCFWFLLLGYVLLLPWLIGIDRQWGDRRRKESPTVKRCQGAGEHLGKSPIDNFRSGDVPRVPRSVDSALQSLLDLCVDKFFKSWHDEQCDCTAVTNEIRRLIRRIVVVLYWRLEACDLHVLVFDRLCPILVVHFGRFASLRPTVACQQPLEIEQRIIEALDGHLHPAVCSRENEFRYLRSVASLLAKTCFPDIDEWSESASRFLRELIAFGLLLPLMDTMANTNCLNRVVCGLLTPDVDYGPPEHCDIELLDGFCDDRPDGLLPSLSLDEILSDQPSFFAFMSFLKAERAPLVFVQFLLSARQILDKLNGEEAISGNREGMSHVHWEAWELYRNYLHADLGESFVNCLSSGLVEAIKAAVEADSQTFPTKILRPLCSAYDHVYTMLQNSYVGPFCSSLYFYDLLFGEIQFDACATDRGFTGSPTTKASGLPSANKESDNGEMMTSLSSSPSRSSSSEGSPVNSDDEVYDLEDAVLSPRDMSKWKVCVPRVEPRRDQHTGRTTYVYVVEICRTLSDPAEEGDGCYMLQWNVDRRYHEFYVLEAKLIEFHGEDILKGFPLPPKKSLRTKPRAFVVSWRPTFDQFVKRLLANPVLKNSELLFTFLTAREELNFGILPDPIKAMRRVPVRLQRERGQNLASFMQNLVLSCTFDSMRHCSVRSKGSVDSVQSEKWQLHSSSSSSSHRLQRNHTIDSMFGNNFGTANGDCGSLTDCRVPFRRSFDLLLYLLSKVFGMNYFFSSLCYMFAHIWASSVESLFRRLCQRKLESWLHAKQVAQCIRLLKEVIAVSADGAEMSCEADVELAEYARLRIHEFASSEYGLLRFLLMMTFRRGRRRRRRGTLTVATLDKECTAKQWNDLFETCEKKTKALIARLRSPDRLAVMFNADTEAAIAELQHDYESIMLNDPDGRGREAEAQCWRITFKDTYQLACSCIWSLKPGQVERLVEKISKASTYYRGLMKAIANKASEEVRKLTLTGPVGHRWNPISIKDNAQDQFALDIMHTAYIHLGDLVRQLSALNAGSLNQGFWGSERLYRCAINLKPTEGSSFSRIASMCADADAHIDAVFYHLLSTKVEHSCKEGQQYLDYLFEVNDKRYSQNESQFKKLDYLQVNAESTKLFPCSCLHVFHYLYKPPSNWKVQYISALCQENLRFVDACFRYCCLCRFPGLETAHFNASTVRMLVAMQIMLIKHLQEKNNIPLMVVAVSWMLSLFSAVVVAVEDFIRICYESAEIDVGPFPNGTEDPCKQPQGIEFPVSKPECANAPKTEYGQEGKNTDVSMTIQKLSALERLRWLEVLKVMCDWLSSHPNLTHSMDMNIWPRLVCVLNALPNEAELAEAASAADTPIAKEAVELFSTPLSSWLQTLALPEDIDLYAVIQAGFVCDERVSSFDHLSACFLRVCSLLSFGHGLIYIRMPRIAYDPSSCTFVCPPDAKTITTYYDVLREDCKTTVPGLIKKKDPMPNIPVHLVPDPYALTEQVHLIKEMLWSGNHILIITMSTMEKLAQLRKNVENARQAANWLEYELDRQNNYICVHSCDYENEDARQKNDANECPYMDIIDACCRLQGDESGSDCNAAILTGHYVDTDKYENFLNMAERLPNAVVCNVYRFYMDWFHSCLYKTYHQLYGDLKENKTETNKEGQ